jgi:hypothetical protein
MRVNIKNKIKNYEESDNNIFVENQIYRNTWKEGESKLVLKVRRNNFSL